MKRFPSLLSLVLLTSTVLFGCNGSTVRSSNSGSVEVAVSRQDSSSVDRQRAKVHSELGRLYLQDGRYDIALSEAEIAFDADSGYAPAYNLQALVFMALRNSDSAEESFRKALNLAPNDPEIHNDFGWFLCQTGKAQESIGHFKVAIDNRLYTSPVKALTNAGLCSLSLKSDRQAEDYLQRALTMDRTNVAALYWLADIAYRDQRLAEARQRLKDLHVQIDPTAESAWLALRVDRKLGDRESEARNMGTLRRKYRESPEYQKLMRGEFD